MDRDVRAKFYRVSDRDEGGLSFDEQIADFIHRYPRALEREYTTGSNHLVRLETVEDDGDWISGNFRRIQTENIPPEVTDDGLEAVRLANGRGLGHQNAFLFHRPTRVILWQQNRLGVSFQDLLHYLNRDVDFVSFFIFEPVGSEEAWDHFANNNVKKAVIKFAGERPIDRDADEIVPTVVQARDIAERYAGLEVEVTISVGRSRQHFLNKHRLGDTIRRLGLRDDVQKLKVTTDGDLNEKVLDFIEEHMENVQTLDLPSDNPVENYAVRRQFLRHSFESRLTDLVRRYAQ